MPTFVTLIRFTEQGAGNFKDTTRRAAAFKEAVGRGGITVREQLWTLGAYDGVLVVEAPDEATITAAMLNLSALGNVRTQTMPAFDEKEMADVLSGASGRETSGGSGVGSKGGKRGR